MVCHTIPAANHRTTFAVLLLFTRSHTSVCLLLCLFFFLATLNSTQVLHSVHSQHPLHSPSSSFCCTIRSHRYSPVSPVKQTAATPTIVDRAKRQLIKKCERVCEKRYSCDVCVAREATWGYWHRKRRRQRRKDGFCRREDSSVVSSHRSWRSGQPVVGKCKKLRSWCSSIRSFWNSWKSTESTSRCRNLLIRWLERTQVRPETWRMLSRKYWQVVKNPTWYRATKAWSF